MTWYSFLLFVHVAMAVIWVGGGLMMQIFVIRASMSGEPSRMARSARTSSGSRIGSSSPRRCSPF